MKTESFAKSRLQGGAEEGGILRLLPPLPRLLWRCLSLVCRGSLVLLCELLSDELGEAGDGDEGLHSGVESFEVGEEVCQVQAIVLRMGASVSAGGGSGGEGSEGGEECEVVRSGGGRGRWSSGGGRW